MRDKLRTVRLTPYRKGCGPSFTLHMWATDKTDSRGQTRIAYELLQHENGKTRWMFQGEDFSGSPMHADDSDATVAALLGFLTLRPGDTDREYFDDYSQVQLDYCALHAESLSCYVSTRFGEN